MRLPTTAALTLACIALCGCSIKQTVTPVSFYANHPPEICMIPAEGLRAGFNTVYTAQLRNKGFKTRELPPGTPPSTCALSTLYVGRWSWDLGLYMAWADIQVFENGRRVGQTLYDSTWGGLRLDKYINAQRKIIQMTNQLFPAASYATQQVSSAP
ncbi:MULTISPECIES: Sbal_3080 family lipoprotein [Pseudomonas]|uniref:Sbal_3080 family lipoprotein n=1 Tax=Pseudomonas TaxID=286 RepID=UPI000CFC39F1|nr:MULTISPECIES: Sbal_3080 family lipoprotein [Pseudomonas]PQZ91197.1 hypothetical protein CQ048_11895 [Pseudomonas trivialis]PRB27310.1 hypothetical protein CQ041_11480 [Pseudomonas sp. MYb60]